MPQVTWRELTAEYSADEQAVMAELTAAVRAGDAQESELVALHELKSFLGARIVEYWEPSELTSEQANAYAVSLFTALDATQNDERAPQRRLRRHEAHADQGSVFV